MIRTNYAFFGATVSLLFLCALFSGVGCDRREEASATPAADKAAVDKSALPEVYSAEKFAFAKDPEFKAELNKLGDVQKDLQKRFGAAVERMRVIEAEVRGDLAAARKIAEYRALEAAREDLKNRMQALRKEMLKAIHNRSQRALADTERIAKGEAKAIEIPAKTNVKKEEK